MSLYHTIRDVTPWPIRQMSRMIKREVHWAINAHRPTKAVFRRAYHEERWGHCESEFYSGPGSVGCAAELYAECIKSFIRQHGVRSVVDLGCGDFKVASRIVSDQIDYIGVDVVDEVVELNNQRFGSPHVRFMVRDITRDALPDGELCLIREVLQHLSNHEIGLILQAVAKYRYVIYSDYQPALSSGFVPNRDIPHGFDTRLWKSSAVCLDQAPFNCKLELLLEVESPVRLRGPGECIRTFLMTPPAPAVS